MIETRHSCLQANHSEVYEASSHAPAKRPEVGNLCAQSRSTDLGVRLFAGHRSLLSTARRPSSSSNCASLRVSHVGVTRSPTDPWVAQHLREATPYGQAPQYLICDHDSKFGPYFARVATSSAIEILKTPVHAKRPNAICERFAQECATRMP
jgi:hypothetical protein